MGVSQRFPTDVRTATVREDIMPELPEVETNMRNLARWIGGRTIVHVTPPAGSRELGGLSPRAFVDRVQGRTVENVTRRGKWMLMKLSGGAGVALHLGMTGKIALAKGELPRFTRAAFELDDGEVVCFVDMRRFGKLLADPRYDDLVTRGEIGEVGPDALYDLDAATLRSLLAATKRTVKEAIMDQRVIAGVGNLYATEALWRAKIHPATPAPKVAADAKTTRALLDGIKKALKQGLDELAGEEVPEYIEEGAPNPFFAYDRAGEPCSRCGTKIKSMTLGGRTTAYCPTCQPKSRAVRASRVR
jgi:formamidopyrimidine-DNA glycosylase